MSRGGSERTREVVYGRRAVLEAERGPRRVHRVLSAKRDGAEELTRVAGSPDHQGIVAEVDPYAYADPGALLGSEDALVIALDEVQDPHNLGAVCRVAEFAGAAGVVITERRAASVTAAVCKASAGAVEHLAIARVRNLTDWLGLARGQGAWIYGAAGEAETRAWDAALTGRVVLVLGGEQKGLRPRVRSACDQLISLPRGGVTDSLNVSTAASALCFEAARQRVAGSRSGS
ncbi:MAG: 23S rRNA (guanosine(2251)-2'-O)-methyltransferase RlmB [Solirubrobacterales bacterium]|nr:23S rRNA (guanosine(2251)-2'-O)-methyltransferase RlmB [Solirubrobacterales bacterium]